MKRLRVFLLPLALIFGMAGTSIANADSLLEKILVTVIADRFGIDTSDVIMLRRDTGLSYDGLGELLSASHQFGASPRDVWRLRRQGMGWGQVAHRLGMHPGTFNKMRNAGAFDYGPVWHGAISQRFGMPYDDVVVVRRSGGSLEDVIAAVLIAKATRRDPQDVYDMYRSTRNWDTMFDRYDVEPSRWQTYVVAPAKPVKVKWTKVSSGPSKGSLGKSNAKRKAVGKAKVPAGKGPAKAPPGQQKKNAPPAKGKGNAKGKGGG